MLVVIDDAQWLDESSLDAMLFAGRRLGAEGIACSPPSRDRPGRRIELDPWLERLEVGPLEPEDARALLEHGRAARRPASPSGWSPAPPAIRSRCWRSRRC